MRFHLPASAATGLEQASTGSCCLRSTRGSVAALFVLALLARPAEAQRAVQGDRIVNVASVTQGGETYTSEAVVRLRIPVPATIEIQHYAPTAPGATRRPVVRGAHRTGPQETDAFASLPLPTLAGSGPLDVSGAVPLLRRASPA